MYKKECEGSFTIEAAFVVPVVLSVMCILIWLTMFMHDASVTYSKLFDSEICVAGYLSGASELDGDSCEGSAAFTSPLKLKVISIDSGDIAVIKAYLSRRMSSGMFLFDTDHVDAVYENGMMVTSVYMKYKFFPFMSLLLKGKTYEEKVFTVKNPLYMDAERTRMVSVAVDAFIKAVNNNSDAGTEPKNKGK